MDYSGLGFADSFNLYWTDDGSEPDEQKNMISGITSEYFNHGELDYTKTYKYRIQSVRNGFTGELSAAVSATPKFGSPDIPQNLKISLTGGMAQLSWDPVNGSDISYRVKRNCIPVDGYYKTIAEDLVGPSFSDTDISPGQGYF